ncbi:hypothetical protein [Variovorax sp. UC122_21]
MRIGESPSLPVPGPPACARERPSP